MKNKLVKLLMIAGLAVAGVACTTQPAKNDSVPWQAGNDVEAFLMDYANANGGLTWGRSASYPEYEKVKEGDTLLIELAQGPCLMEFFHSRWRRANDVRRWNPSVNEYGGCPYVFD